MLFLILTDTNKVQQTDEISDFFLYFSRPPLNILWSGHWSDSSGRPMPGI